MPQIQTFWLPPRPQTAGGHWNLDGQLVMCLEIPLPSRNLEKTFMSNTFGDESFIEGKQCVIFQN